jgi:hypothetical protein
MKGVPMERVHDVTPRAATAVVAARSLQPPAAGRDARPGVIPRYLDNGDVRATAQQAATPSKLTPKAGDDIAAPIHGEGKAAGAAEPHHSRSPRGHRTLVNSPDFVSWYSWADPLAPYTVFKAASPAGYAALKSTAEQYTLRPAEEASERAPGTGWRTQTEVAVAALLRPRLPPYGALASLRDRLWPVLTADEQDSKAAAAVLQDEVIGRWAIRNTDLLSTQVRVRLMLPGEAPLAPLLGTPEAGVTGVGPQEVLEFTIGDQRIRTLDGSMDPVTLDLLGSNDFEICVAEVAAEASVIAQAADYLRTTATLIEAEGRYWEDVSAEPDAFALNDVTQHLTLLSIMIIMDGAKLAEGGYQSPWAWRIQEFLSEHAEYASELAASLDAMSALTARALPAFEAFADRHNLQSLPETELAEMKPDIDAAKKRADERWDEGSRFVAVCDYMSWGLGEVIWGTANLATGDYYETRHQGLSAYRQGSISKHQFNQLDEAASGRAIASFTVFAALTLVTAGLGGAVLGPAAGLGRTMLVAGASNAVTTAGTMTTTSVYTRQKDFEDPTAQGIWRHGAYSPGDIAVSSLVAGSIGAAVPVAGMTLSKLLGWIRAVRPTPAVALALRQAGAVAPELPPPSGWMGEEVSAGTFRLTHPNVPGEIILTPYSFRYQTPTGTGGMRVEFDLPLSSSAAGPKSLAAPQQGLPPGSPIGPDDIDAALGRGFQSEGPLVSAPIDSVVLDVGSGPSPANLGLGDETGVQIVRTDIVETFGIDRVFDAEGTLADDLVGSAQALVINNPYGYKPNLAELGRAVRPGGKIIIQGNPKVNKYVRALINEGPPKGFVVSVGEGFDPKVDLPATATAGPDVMAETIRRNILGGPFRFAKGGAGGPRPNARVVYEKPIEGPKALGKRLGAESKGKPSRYNYVAGGLNALQLGQHNAVQAAKAATEEMGLHLTQTTVGDDIVLLSVMPGRGKPILVVKPDGTVLRGEADISHRVPLNLEDPLEPSNIVEDPPILPGR